MAVVGLMQCNVVQAVVVTHQLLNLHIPPSPLYVLSSVVFQHKSSKSLHFTSSPSRVVTTNEGLGKIKSEPLPLKPRSLQLVETPCNMYDKVFTSKKKLACHIKNRSLCQPIAIHWQKSEERFLIPKRMNLFSQLKFPKTVFSE